MIVLCMFWSPSTIRLLTASHDVCYCYHQQHLIMLSCVSGINESCCAHGLCHLLAAPVISRNMRAVVRRDSAINSCGQCTWGPPPLPPCYWLCKSHPSWLVAKL